MTLDLSRSIEIDNAVHSDMYHLRAEPVYSQLTESGSSDIIVGETQGVDVMSEIEDIEIDMNKINNLISLHLQPLPSQFSKPVVEIDTDGTGYSINSKAMLPNVRYPFVFKGAQFNVVLEDDGRNLVVYELVE